jgi:RNA polymerase sigma factor (TIGR02999 family)
MRRILVEWARRRSTGKRGGGAVHHSLDEEQAVLSDRTQEVIAIDELLDMLAGDDRLSAELVKLRYFAGFTMDEAAEALGISTRKAHYIWAYARSWLRRELANG